MGAHARGRGPERAGGRSGRGAAGWRWIANRRALVKSIWMSQHFFPVHPPRAPGLTAEETHKSFHARAAVVAPRLLVTGSVSAEPEAAPPHPSATEPVAPKVERGADPETRERLSRVFGYVEDGL